MHLWKTEGKCDTLQLEVYTANTINLFVFNRNAAHTGSSVDLYRIHHCAWVLMGLIKIVKYFFYSCWIIL
jgi:hypothetical protein